MYCTPPTTQKARKPHVCDGCMQRIEVGERYKRWACYEDTCMTTKMHLECVEVLRDDAHGGSFEFVRGEVERPEEQLGFKTYEDHIQ